MRLFPSKLIVLASLALMSPCAGMALAAEGPPTFDAPSNEPFTYDVRRGGASFNYRKERPRPRPAVATLYEEEKPVEPAPPPAPVMPQPAPQPAPAAPPPAPAQPAAPPPSTTPPQLLPAEGKSIAEILESGSNEELASLGRQAEARRDAALASALGWAFFKHSEQARAEQWFAKSAQWSGSGADVAYGRALAAFARNDAEAARRLITPLLDKGDEKAELLIADINSRLAYQAYEAGNYRETIRLLHQTYARRYLSLREQLLIAWSYLYSSETEKSRLIFEGLYRAYKDNESADGFVAAVLKSPPASGDAGAQTPSEIIAKLASEVGGPIGQNPAAASSAPASRLVAGGRHIAALAGAFEDAEKNGAFDETIIKQLKEVPTTSASIGAAFSTKSGSDGLGKLSIMEAPLVSLRTVLGDRHELTVQASLMHLDAGTPKASYYDPIGKAPIVVPDDSGAIIYPDFTHKTTDRVSRRDFNLNYRYHGKTHSPYFALGLGPKGIDQSKLNGRLGITSFFEKGAIMEAEIFHLPVKESLLSYTGITDPWTGAKWGQVMETGARLSSVKPFENDWSLRASGYASRLDGTKVENNYSIGINLGMRKDLPSKDVPLFGEVTYLAVGPDLGFLHYEKNLSRFTWGNGGYFSPEYMFQLNMGANLLTKEGRSWIAKFDASAGYQTNEQADSPYFPLDPSHTRRHDSTSSSGLTFSVQAGAATLLTPRWIFGGSIGTAKTKDYHFYTLKLQFSYLFGNRIRLYREDLYTP